MERRRTRKDVSIISHDATGGTIKHVSKPQLVRYDKSGI